jgi:metal-responsive CopG/Arc/MetJ family transcriptional regulator
MKTAISLPDELFASADVLAKRLKVSRSKLYATALAEYVAKHRDEQITARLNAVYRDHSGGIEPRLRSAQARSLVPDAW